MALKAIGRRFWFMDLGFRLWVKSSDVGLIWCFRLALNPLGGSWVVTSGAISKVTILITLVGGLITPLLTALEPTSSPRQENMKLVEEERIFLQKRLA